MELMTMISERQRFFERICQWLELAKMRYPLFAGQSAKTHRLSPAIIAKMQDRSREIRRGDWVAYFLPQGKNGGFGMIFRGLPPGLHTAIRGMMRARFTLGGIRCEALREGKACGGTCRYGGSMYH